MRFDPKNPVIHEANLFPDTIEALVARTLVLCRVFVRAAKAQQGKPGAAVALARARRSHEGLLDLLPQLEFSRRVAFHTDAKSLDAEISGLAGET